MTMILKRQLTCAVCGREQEVKVLASTNTFGSPDLDTRPSGHGRWSLLHAIMRCEECGYAAPDLSEAPEGLTRDELPTKGSGPGAYQSLLAVLWDCRSMVCERYGRFDESGWAALSAAWACDDSEADEPAVSYRKRAIAASGNTEGGLQVR
jgi:hypothetical protein